MTAVSKILAGGAMIAALATAAPAAAQYSNSYPGYGYGNSGGGALGAILDSILGGRSYANNDRTAIQQCVAATEARLNGGYGNSGYGQYGYGQQGYGQQGYNNAYGYNNAGRARVVQITNVQRRSNGVKVYGMASSGQYGQYGGQYDHHNQNRYGNSQYGYGNSQYAAGADLRFNCKVDYRGRVTDVDIDRTRRY